MTYSIVARDPATGELGVAVQSHVPSVGSLCPFAEADAGVVATQSVVERAYGPRGLAAMAAGAAAPEALARLLDEDPQRALRQVAFVDLAGRIAVHTGERCIAHAGHVLGNDFACQANMMTNPGVPEAMAAAFERAVGDLAHRMLDALDAAEAAGGDIRGMQSAALIVVGPRRLDRRVDDHPAPLAELRRLVDLGEDHPEGWFWSGVQRAFSGDVDGGCELVARAYGADEAWRELLRRLLPTGLLPEAPQVVERLLGAAPSIPVGAGDDVAVPPLA